VDIAEGLPEAISNLNFVDCQFSHTAAPALIRPRYTTNEQLRLKPNVHNLLATLVVKQGAPFLAFQTTSPQGALLPCTGQRVRRPVGDFRGVYSPCFSIFALARTRANRSLRLVDLMKRASYEANSEPTLVAPA
jgi:hypothetical protein